MAILFFGPLGDELIEPATLQFNFAALGDWVKAGDLADGAADTRGGPEDPLLDADWLLREVSPDDEGNVFEFDSVIDLLPYMDWQTCSDHFWE